MCIPTSPLSTDEEEFIKAAKENSVRRLKKLLSGGVDVNCRHPLGWNALHSAVVNGSWDTIKLLVESGADVNAKDEFSSALRIAAQRGTDSSRGT
jgi:ankyrin repeat protein